MNNRRQRERGIGQLKEGDTERNGGKEKKELKGKQMQKTQKWKKNVKY